MSHDDLKLRRAEESYFLEQNQLLIRKLHEEMAAQAESKELGAHKGKCSECGHDMAAVALHGCSVQVCYSCEHLSLSSHALVQLLDSAKGRQELARLHSVIKRKELRSA